MSKSSRARTDRIVLISFGLAIGALYLASFHLESITGVGLNNLISAIRFLVDKSIKPLFIGVFFGTIFSLIFPHKYNSFLLAGSGLKPIFNALWLGIFTKKCTYQDLQTNIIQSKIGVSIGATITSLLVSPVNSFSFLFLILSLYGLGNGALLISGLFLIALFSGIIFDLLHYYKVIPRSEMISRVNPNFNIFVALKADLNLFSANFKLLNFLKESLNRVAIEYFMRMKLTLKWYFLGIFLSGLLVGGLGEAFIRTFEYHYYLVLVAIIIFSALIEILDEAIFILSFTLYYFTGEISFSLVLIMSNIVFELIELPEMRKEFDKKSLILFSIIPIVLTIVFGLIIK